MSNKISRADFLKVSATGLAAIAMGACASESAAPVASAAQSFKYGKRLPVGVQMYSVRTDLEKDFYGCLKQIADMGYHGVEFFGEYYGNSILQIRKWCTELKLIPFSNHIAYQDMIDNLDQVIADCTLLGCQYIVFPYMDEASRPSVNAEQFKKTVANLGEIGAKLHEQGFQLLYHNHDFEFFADIEGVPGYDYMFKSNKPENLMPEMDTCWVSYAGKDPVEYLKKYKNNIPVVHVKDYFLEGKLKSAPYALIGISTDNSMKDEGGSFEYRYLGSGQNNIEGILETAIANGAQWLCVEQDEPQAGLTRLEGIANSAKYLKEQGLL